MRANRVFVIAVLAFAAGAAGCGQPRAHMLAGPTVAPAAHRHAPAPSNPDLATLMERYYQLIEGAHWPFAYAMLSPRYRASLDQDHFVAMYDRYTDPNVRIHQTSDRVVVATFWTSERDNPSRTHLFEETTTLAWDGEDWKIERIARRDVTRTGTHPGARI